MVLVPGDKSIRRATEAKHAAISTIDNGSEFIAASAERMRELVGVQRSIKAEGAKGLHTNEKEVRVMYWT